jgi:hypothetical protein
MRSEAGVTFFRRPSRGNATMTRRFGEVATNEVSLRPLLRTQTPAPTAACVPAPPESDSGIFANIEVTTVGSRRSSIISHLIQGGAGEGFHCY